MSRWRSRPTASCSWRTRCSGRSGPCWSHRRGRSGAASSSVRRPRSPSSRPTSAPGRAIVAWSTYDGGEEQNVARRVYAATRALGARSFAAATLVHRAGARNDFAFLEPGIRLTVAPSGRALLMVAGPERTDDPSASFSAGRPRVESDGRSSVRIAP